MIIIVCCVLILIIFEVYPLASRPLEYFRKQVSSSLWRFATFIQKLSTKFAGQNKTADDVFYGDLTPDDDSDQNGVYEKRILSGIRNQNVKNIALTGPYGSGKSSILKTFQKKHPEYRYLNISLATFKEGLAEEGKADPSEKGQEPSQAGISSTQELIELSILQQLFYYVKYKHIPGSRFKRIKKQSRASLSVKGVGIILFVGAVILLWKGNDLQKSENIRGTGIETFFKSHAIFLFYLEIVLAISGLFLLLYTLLRIYSNSKLHKLSLSSGEIELAPNDSSILNKHLDEILYFFEATKYNVVLFEDLDRFQNPEIFTKLREINTLVNNSLQINRKIVFIYALKDEIFKNEKRTKFFDLIIPVIPIITSVNSGDMLQQVIRKRGLSDSLPDRFLRDIGLYIGDMRLLKNVLNEFLLYNDQFKDVGIDKKNLFAMVLYKNIDPADFADLQNNRGVVADFFREKPSYVTLLSNDRQSRIKRIDELVQELERSTQENIGELRLTYIGGLITELPDNYFGIIYINNQALSRKGLLEDQNFKALLQQNSINYQARNQFNQLQQVQFNRPFTEIEKIVNPLLTYQQREDLIRESRAKGIDLLKQEKEKLIAELQEIQSYSVKEIFDHDAPKEMQDRLSQRQLLSYLIRYGYIDEQFPYYISRFYEGDLSKTDLDFLLSIKNNIPLPATAPLNQVANLLSNLSPAELEKTPALNDNLVDFLSSHRATYEDLWGALGRQLSNESKESATFIDQYIDRKKNIGPFLTELSTIWTTMWDFIDSRSGYSTQKKDIYLRQLCINVPIPQLLQLNESAQLSKYMAEKADFLSFAKGIDLFKMQDIIGKLAVRFDALIHVDENAELLDYIYNTSSYALNQHMVNFMMRRYGGADNDALIDVNYTQILHSSCLSLIQYIQDNFLDFINNLFLNGDVYRDESEETLIKILGRDDLDGLTIVKIIKRSSRRITDLSKVGEELWSTLLSLNKIKPSWNNILKYEETEGWDNTLSKYINFEDVYTELAESVEDIVSREPERVRGFLKIMIESEEVKDNAALKITRQAQMKFSDLDFTTISEARAGQLLKDGVLAFSDENFSGLKSLHGNQNLHLQLIRKNWIDFFSGRSEFELSLGEYTEVLGFGDVPLSDRQTILEEIDLNSIPTKLATEFARVVLANRLQITDSVFKQLSGEISDHHLTIGLLTTLPMIDKGAVENVLSKLGQPYSDLLSQETSEVDVSDSNRSLLNYLKKKRLISNYKEKKGRFTIEPLKD